VSSLLDSVGLVLSYFIEWLTSLTTALIGNPVIQLVFAVGIIFTIINFVLCLLIDRSNNKSSKKTSSFQEHLNSSNWYDVYDGFDVPYDRHEEDI